MGTMPSVTPTGHRGRLPSLNVGRAVDAPAERVWDLLTDTHRWPAWGPSVTGVVCDDRYVRPGSRGRVRIVGGVWLPFEVTSCGEYAWRWRVAGVPATGHRVEPLDGRCRVVFEVPVLAAAYAPVCAVALRRIEDLVVAGTGR